VDWVVREQEGPLQDIKLGYLKVAGSIEFRKVPQTAAEICKYQITGINAVPVSLAQIIQEMFGGMELYSFTLCTNC
jgi:hypothetical protein